MILTLMRTKKLQKKTKAKASLLLMRDLLQQTLNVSSKLFSDGWQH